MEREKSVKAYSIWYSQAVTHLSTNQTRSCLSSVIGREQECSTLCGRRHYPAIFSITKPDQLPKEKTFLYFLFYCYDFA